MMHIYFLLSRAMTLGVRAAVFDPKGRIFLVRHSYVPGWHMPGGGVERGETSRQALEKELREEGNIALTEEPALFGVYYNKATSGRDHVVFYCCRNVRQTAPKQADREIVEAGFFALNDLPAGVTRATRRRIAEIAGTETPAAYW